MSPPSVHNGSNHYYRHRHHHGGSSATHNSNSNNFPTLPVGLLQQTQTVITMRKQHPVSPLGSSSTTTAATPAASTTPTQRRPPIMLSPHNNNNNNNGGGGISGIGPSRSWDHSCDPVIDRRGSSRGYGGGGQQQQQQLLPAGLQQPHLLTLAPRYRSSPPQHQQQHQHQSRRRSPPPPLSDNRSVSSDIVGGAAGGFPSLVVGTGGATPAPPSANFLSRRSPTGAAAPVPVVTPASAAPSSDNRSVVSESYLAAGSRSGIGRLSSRSSGGRGRIQPHDMPSEEMDTRSLHSVASSESRKQEIRRLAENRLLQAQQQQQQQRLQQQPPQRHHNLPLSSSSSSLPGDFPTTPRSNGYYGYSNNGAAFGRMSPQPPHLPLTTLSSPYNDDDVSTLGGVEDQTSAVQRMTLAIRNHSARPSSLTREERGLWDAIQAAVKQAAAGSSRNNKSNSNKSDSITLSNTNEADQDSENAANGNGGGSAAGTAVALTDGSDNEWKLKYEDLRTSSAEKEQEHSSSLRAIQRVLADVTSERDKALEKQANLLKEKNQQQSQEGQKQDSLSRKSTDEGETTTEDLEKEIQALRLQVASKDNRIRDLEGELAASKLETSTLATSESVERQKEERLRQRLEVAEAEKDRLVAQLDTSRDEARRLLGQLQESNSRSASPTSSSGEVENLRRQYSDKSSALENAKMIIASLESASGKLAADMRAKLKIRDDEITVLKAALADKQKSLDNLATQLRDLQRESTSDSGNGYVKGKNFRSSRAQRIMDEERSRRLGLSSRLEKNMADIRAASVVLESTNDPATADELSELLSDSILALKDGIDVIEEATATTAEDSSVDGVDSTVSCADSVSVCSSRSTAAPVDIRRLRKELDDRTKALQQVEEALRREKEESAQLKADRDGRRLRDEEVQSLRQEVVSLREQCQTNMEVLTRKERELVVLRDSLKVDDGVGYISDDGSDGTESDVGTDAGVSSSVAHFGAIVPHYGPAQAEALAILLANGGTNAGGPPPSEGPNGGNNSSSAEVQRELSQARVENEKYRKQLKTEKESLANAKMIISSLERANKSMMEDLRSRLQDSNTAIASLLEKSIQSEKTTNKLREEMESLRNEKDELERKLRSSTSSLSPFSAGVSPGRRSPASPRTASGFGSSTTMESSSAFDDDEDEDRSDGGYYSLEEKKDDFLFFPTPEETID